MSKLDVRELLASYMELGDVNGYCSTFARYYDILSK